MNTTSGVRGGFVCMKSQGVMFLFSLVVALVGLCCSSGTENTNGECVEGTKIACQCDGGEQGLKECGPDKTYGACVCDSGSDAGTPDGEEDGSDESPPTYRIFVTSATYNGDLLTAGEGRTGLDGANKICERHAAAAGLGGSWRAWLSNLNSNAIERIPNDGPWYLIGTGGLVFQNKTALTATPRIPIDRDENGNTIVMHTSLYVWTGTEVGGTAHAYNCVGWRVAGVYVPAHYSRVGDILASDNGWTSSLELRCDDQARLYCIETDGTEPTQDDQCVGDVIGNVGRLYVVPSESKVLVLETTNYEIVDEVPIPYRFPEAIAVDTGTQKVFALSSTSSSIQLQAFDTTCHAPPYAFPDASYAFWDLTVNPSTSRLYVPNMSNTITVVNTESNAPLTSINFGKIARQSVLSPSGDTLFALTYVDGAGTTIGQLELAIADTGSNQVTGTVAIPDENQLPKAIGVHMGSKHAYAALGSGRLAVVDIVNNTVIDSLTLSSAALSVSVHESGEKAYIGLGNSSIEILNTATNTVAGTINLVGQPKMSVLDEDASRLYVAIANEQIAVIDTTSDAVVNSISINDTIQTIALMPASP